MNLKINKKLIDLFNDFCYNKCDKNMYQCHKDDDTQVHRCLKEFRKNIKSSKKGENNKL